MFAQRAKKYFSEGTPTHVLRAQASNQPRDCLLTFNSRLPVPVYRKPQCHFYRTQWLWLTHHLVLLWTNAPAGGVERT